MIRIAVLASPTFGALNRLPKDPDVDVVVAHDVASLGSAVRGAEVMLISPRYGAQLRDLWPEMRAVRWIHCLGAGVETLPFDLLRQRDIIVTNGRGVYADALAEFSMAAMLWFAKGLRKLAENQAARRWQPGTVERLEGATAGIVGYGAIGQAVARRAEAFGMRILALRHAGGTPLDELLPASDYVVVSTPLTEETRGLINACRFGQMRPTAVLINVGRGAVVDENDLIQALRSGQIRGAALDVFETEPLPPENALWGLPNILISPHMADHAVDSHDRAMRVFLRNLERFRRGEALENVVDKDAGY